MQILKKVIRSLNILFSGFIKITRRIFKGLFLKIRKTPLYLKVGVIYILVIGIMTGFFLWRARNYYPEIPLGKEESIKNDSLTDVNNPENLIEPVKPVDQTAEPGKSDGTAGDTGEDAGLNPEIGFELLWPVEGGKNNVEVGFGEVISHETRSGVIKSSHKGIDICVPEGAEVIAAADGTVAAITENDSLYGKTVLIKHSGDVYTFYASLMEIAVTEGEKITGGRVIGKVGRTAVLDSGLQRPYLHFEIRVSDRNADPLIFLP